MRYSLRTWSLAEEESFEICSVAWSNSVPSVFFATTSHGKLLCWDILEDDKEPLYSEAIPTGDDDKKKTTCRRSMLSVSSTRIQTASPSLTTAIDTSVAVFKLSREFARPGSAQDIQAVEAYLQHVL